MRNICAGLLLLATALCSGNSRAQSSYYEEKPQVFTGGLIVGANFTQVDGDTYYGYYKAGINAGGTVYVHFSEYVGVSMELLYAQKGVRGVAVSGSQYIGTYDEKYYLNLNYAEVPILFHVRPGKSCIWWGKLDFEAGLSYARLISSKEWAENDVPVYFSPSANAFKNSDFDYVLGLTVKAYKNFYVNARYQYSITTIRNPNNIPLGFGYGGEGQYNNTCALRLMYIF